MSEKWLPIEQAPRDGSPVVIGRAEEGSKFITFWCSSYWGVPPFAKHVKPLWYGWNLDAPPTHYLAE